jgi:hypothetical protein
VRYAFVLAAVILSLGATSAFAAEPWIGRWAEETKFCTKPGTSGNETPMAFTRTTARWFGACKIRSIRKQGATWILKAKCPSARPLLDIRLSMQGKKLEAFWGEAHPQVMVRCR